MQNFSRKIGALAIAVLALVFAIGAPVALAAQAVDGAAVLGFVAQLAGSIDWSGLGALSVLGTTLAVNKSRTYGLTGGRNDLPVIASDIIYEGAAVGLVYATGHCRPLTSSDRFAGFAEFQADNSAGAAAAINVRLVEDGEIVLSVSGVTITDIGQPVYATDDDTFVMSPVSGVFVGFVKRFVSTNNCVVDFDATCYRDPYGNFTVRAALSADTTLDATYSGSLIWVTADAKIITLPAIATGLDGCMIVNGGSYGTIAVNVSPNASDMILGPGITGADNKDLINTKATARRGDFVIIGGNDADGYSVQALRGTWAREA